MFLLVVGQYLFRNITSTAAAAMTTGGECSLSFSALRCTPDRGKVERVDDLRRYSIRISEEEVVVGPIQVKSKEPATAPPVSSYSSLP